VDRNVDRETVAGFGAEWTLFDFESQSSTELDRIFGDYFSIFPWDRLPPDASGFDLGAGSGRWAARVAPRVGTLHVVDASAEALAVARRTLASHPNCRFHHASVDAIPLADASMDFGYSLGVLHHVPDSQAGLAACVAKLKPGAPFLLYLYYALENRPAAFRAAWRVSDALRKVVARLPFAQRRWVAEAIAASIYFPLARGSLVLERLGADVDSIPLSSYRRRPYYFMRNDALDRFGTKLEKRFTRAQIEEMMTQAGLSDIRFREGVPYWCALGYRTKWES
jgi:ubiquinone/menaquinone biosynthesis C-methylase UbiE